MTKKAKKRGFRLMRAVSIVAVSLLVVSVIILFLVRLGTFDRVLLAEISRRLEASSGLRLEAEEIAIDPFRLSASFKKPILRAIHETGPVLREFTALALFIDVPGSMIFGGQLRFQKVLVIQPTAVMAPSPASGISAEKTAVSPDLHVSGPSLPDASVEPRGFDLRIEALDIEDGLVSWGEGAKSFGVSIKNIGIRARYDPAIRSHIASFAASDGQLKYSDHNLVLERLDIKGRFSTEEIVVETFEVKTEHSFLNLTGTAKGSITSPEFLANGRLSLSLREIPFPTPLAAGAEGTLVAEFSLGGKEGNFIYEADVSTSGLKTRDIGDMSLAGHIRGDATTLRVTDFDLHSKVGSVVGEVAADRTLQDFSRIDLEWKDLDPDKILSLFPSFEKFADSAGSLLSGRLAGKAESLTPKGFEGSAFLALTPKPPAKRYSVGNTIAPPAKVPSRVRKSPLRPKGEVALHASGGEFVLDTASLSAAGVSLNLSGKLHPDGTIESRYAVKVNSVSETIETLLQLEDIVPLPAGSPFAPENLSGSVSLTGSVRGQLDAPTFTGRLEIPELGYLGVRTTSLHADFEGNPEKLIVRDLSAMMAGGSVRGSGALSLSAVRGIDVSALGKNRGADNRIPEPSLIDVTPPEQFTIEFDNIRLAQIAPVLPPPWNEDTKGLFSGEAEISLAPEGPDAVLSARLTSLFSQGVELPRLEFKVDYSADRIAVSDFLAQTINGSLSGRGSFDIQREVFSASLYSDGIGLEFLGPFLSPNSDLGGRAVLQLDAEGRISDPRGTVTLSVMDLRFGSTFVSSLEIEARSDGSAAEAFCRIPDYNLFLEGKLALASPYIIRGSLVADDLPVDRIIQAALIPATTTSLPSFSKTNPRLDLNAAFVYPLADPASFSADITFSGKNLSLGSSEPSPEPASHSFPIVSGEGRILAAGNPTAAADIKIEGEIPRLLLAFGETTLSNQDTIRFRFSQGVLHIESMILDGSGGSFSVSGTAGPFPGVPVLDGRIRSDIDISVLSPFATGMMIGGRLKTNIDVRGKASGPSFAGQAVLENAFVRTEDFPLILGGISAELSFEGSRLSLAKLEGTANGGPLRVRGDLEGLFSPIPPSGRFTIEATNVLLNYPPGLRTTSDIALVLAGDGKEWTLAGDMKILRGLFREDISPGGQILGFGSYRWVRSQSELPAFIRGIRLDIAVDTVEPIFLKNNLANVEILADLRVSGNPGLPLFSGRMRNAAVGEIVFSERRFVLERAQLDLLGQRIPNPNLDIVAHTQIDHNLESLEVRLQLSGSSSDLRYSLTSSPPRSKEDLSLILLTGRSLEEVKGNAINTLTAQTIQFFSSPVASPVTRTLERILKAEDVSVEPLIISAEADPGARFTFRKRISEEAAVTYSADITSTHSQTWILDYRLKRNFLLQAFRKDNGSYGGSLRHSIPILAKPPPSTGSVSGPAGGQPILARVTFEGDPKLSANELNGALRRLREGKPFSYSHLSNALDKLLRIYKSRNYANADVRPSVTKSDDGTTTAVHLVFAPGYPIRIVYSGDRVSSRIRRSVKKNWTGLLPEDINLEEARDLLLEKLHKKGHYEARVDTKKQIEGNEKLYEITVEKGPRYSIRSFHTEGNVALTTDRIRKTSGEFPVAKYKGLWNLVYDPQSALDSILNVYRQSGYAETNILAPQISSDADMKVLDLRLMVDEGPRRMIHDIRFEGNFSLAEAELRSVLQSAQGDAYDPALLRKDRDSLLAFCRSRGYREAEVETTAIPRTADPDIGVIFKIFEGPVHTVSGLSVTGARRTQEGLVLKTVRIKKGEIFSFESLAAGQKRLYDLGIFRAVNITAPPPDKESSDVPIVIDVREEPPLTLTYGLRYNSEDKLEGQVELTLVNLLGGGRTGYMSYRKSSRLWDARFSLKLPYLLGFRADTRLSLSAARERREAYISDEIAGTLRQEIRLPSDFSLSLFYRLSRIREKEPDAAIFGPHVVISEFSLNIIRDTRDDRLDPRAGSFLSLSLTGAPKIFGSELPLVKVFTQYSFYRNIGGNVIWASNIRFGLTTAFRQELLSSQLFYAGGGTSIRGFEQDRVGPIDSESGLPAGGKVVLLVNQELRIPLFFWFSGVVFYDTGNVYASFRDLTRFSLRQSIGVGLRAESPIGLIRFDCGFNPFRRPGEPLTAFFLSIGQSF